MRSRGSIWWRLAVAVGLLLACGQAPAQAQVATTTVQGTVYRADGTPAQGSLLVSWTAFVTANGQAVTAGHVTVTVGADGFASLALAPNAGASPAGSYYTVVYHLSDGTVSREFWTVPNTPTATIAGVRTQLQPSMVAVQSVSKSYVDQQIANIAPTAGNYLSIAGGALQGPLALNADPQSGAQATTKHYVDSQVATTLPLTGGTVSGTVAMGNAIAKLPRVDSIIDN